MSVVELFDLASLNLCGPVVWDTPILEKAAGVYVIALADPNLIPTFAASADLTDTFQKRWNVDQEVIYIGRATSLRKRIRQFYRHKHGAPRPHRGGQDIKLLQADVNVYWAVTDNFCEAEKHMIDAFKLQVGQLPFGNKVRSAQSRKKLIPVHQR